MKKILTIALLSTMFTQAFGGIIINKDSGESIEIILDRGSRSLDILSTATEVANKQVQIEEIDLDESTKAFETVMKAINTNKSYRVSGSLFKSIAKGL